MKGSAAKEKKVQKGCRFQTANFAGVGGRGISKGDRGGHFDSNFPAFGGLRAGKPPFYVFKLAEVGRGEGREREGCWVKADYCGTEYLMKITGWGGDKFIF